MLLRPLRCDDHALRRRLHVIAGPAEMEPAVRHGITLLASALLLAACSDKDSYDLDGGDIVTVGSLFVEQRGCPDCHQSSDPKDGKLSGQTVPRPNTMAYPANLTPDHTTGIGDWADIEIVRAMRYGIDNENEPLCPPMPHFDGNRPDLPLMTDLEARAIVAYLRSLPPVTRPIPESRCPPLKPPPMPDLSAPADGGTDG
jgi:hypothetical protein